MTHKPTPGGAPSPDPGGSGSGVTGDEEAEWASFYALIDRLLQAAAAHSRDWKLVDALLRTIVEIILETDGDVFAPLPSGLIADDTTSQCRRRTLRSLRRSPDSDRSWRNASRP